jgi:voltage-gated potassium channel
MGYGLFKGFRLAWRIVTILLVISFFVNLFEGLNVIGMALSGVFLILLYSKRGQFVKPLGVALNVRYLMAVWIMAFVLFYGTFGGYFLGEHFRPPITTFIQALYYTVITATTVGYGDFVPNTDQARLFAVSLILLGVGTFLSAIVLIIQPFMKEVEKIMATWVKSKKE